MYANSCVLKKSCLALKKEVSIKSDTKRSPWVINYVAKHKVILNFPKVFVYKQVTR